MTIKLIEYGKTDNGWMPHSVIKDNETYDFDWCRTQGMLCYHMSGGGGLETASIVKYSNAPKLCGKIWVADGYKVFHGKTELKTKAQFRELGYQKIDNPIEINSSTDPFEYADADEPTEYCKFCDHVPSDQTCSHLHWDEYHGGYLLGCGSQEVCFNQSKASVFRLLRFLSEKQIDRLYKTPYACSAFERCEFEFGWKEENHYAAGLSWLFSLDETTKKPNTMTRGWIYEYQETHFNRIASPESTLWIDLPNKQLSTFLELDTNDHVEKTLTVKFPRKVSSAHDKFFNDSPKSITEVILKPKTKNWQADKVMNIAVRGVEVKKGKAEILFSYFINKGGDGETRFGN
jgi:hypothetical protein